MYLATNHRRSPSFRIISICYNLCVIPTKAGKKVCKNKTSWDDIQSFSYFSLSLHCSTTWVICIYHNMVKGTQYWCSEGLFWRHQFFYLQHVTGLTNQVLVQDSQAGAPLDHSLITLVSCNPDGRTLQDMTDNSILFQLIPYLVSNCTACMVMAWTLYISRGSRIFNNCPQLAKNFKGFWPTPPFQKGYVFIRIRWGEVGSLSYICFFFTLCMFF